MAGSVSVPLGISGVHTVATARVHVCRCCSNCRVTAEYVTASLGRVTYDSVLTLREEIFSFVCI